MRYEIATLFCGARPCSGPRSHFVNSEYDPNPSVFACSCIRVFVSLCRVFLSSCLRVFVCLCVWIVLSLGFRVFVPNVFVCRTPSTPRSTSRSCRRRLFVAGGGGAPHSGESENPSAH